MSGIDAVAKARCAFNEFAESIGSTGADEENAILSVGREFLPACAIAVLDDRDAATVEYYSWLTEESRAAQAEHDRDVAAGHEWHEESVSAYTYTIFDANPATSSGAAWPSHQDLDLKAGSDEEAIITVFEEMRGEACGLNPSDGYEVGQQLYAIVWDADKVIVGEPTYTLTADDLGEVQ